MRGFLLTSFMSCLARQNCLVLESMPGFPVVTGSATITGSAVIPGRTTANTRRYTPSDYAGTEKRRRDSASLRRPQRS